MTDTAATVGGLLQDAEVRYVPVGSLTRHPRNPRRGNVEAIVESLRATGQFRPLLVQASTGYVIAGNHTLAAAEGLGFEGVSVVFLDVDDRTAEVIMVADNRYADLAEWDDIELVHMLRGFDGDLDGTGFTEMDLDVLVASLGTEEPEEPERPGRMSSNDVKFQVGTISWTVSREEWDAFEARLVAEVGARHEDQVAELRAMLQV